MLTGAGVSTDSGIAAYRDDQGAWKHDKPMDYREFVGSEFARRRYWARSFVGFSRMRDARPNLAHQALATLEARGLTTLLVTQNVDGLHQAAGSRSVLDLHGRIDRVVCIACRATSSRQALQEILAQQNPSFASPSARMKPDGDAELVDADTASFRVASCPSCGGVLKPDVVFFGENVPPERVERVMQALARARALLVVGSSLMVFSGFRFVRAAKRQEIPIAIVNRGATRADPLSDLKLAGNAGEVLAEVARELECA